MCTGVGCFQRIRTTAVLPGLWAWGTIPSIPTLGETLNSQLLNEVLAFLLTCLSSPLELKLGLGSCCHLLILLQQCDSALSGM